MRKHMEQKLTKKRPSNNQNQNHNNLLKDHFASNEHYYKYEKDILQNNHNHSQQTDIDIDIDDHPTQHNTWSNQVEKDVEIDTDIIVGKDGKFQRLQIVPVRRNLSTSVETDKSEQSELSLGFDDKKSKQQKKKPQKKKKVYRLKPQTLQRHINQILTNISSSNYPQNVMNRIHPISSDYNKSNKSHNNKSQSQQKQEKSGTKKTTKFTLNKKSQSSNQRTSNWTIISQSTKSEVKNEVKQKKKHLFEKIPKISYERVEFAAQQICSIEQNTTWIAKVVAKRYISQNFGSNHLKQIPITQQQVQNTQKNILQLKCMLRYRSITQILPKVQSMLLHFQQHNEYLVDLNFYYQENLDANRQYFDLNKISIKLFHLFVLEEVSILLISFVLECAFCSWENKELVKGLIEKKGYYVGKVKNFDGEKMILEKSVMDRMDKIRDLFQEQELFQPYKAKFYNQQQKNRELPPYRPTKQHETNIIQLLQNHHSESNKFEHTKIDKKSQKPNQEHQQDVQIDGKTFTQQNSQKDVQI